MEVLFIFIDMDKQKLWKNCWAGFYKSKKRK